MSIRFITDNLSKGNRVMMSTYLTHTVYDARHIEFFQLTDSGQVLVRQGKRWNTANSCRFSVC